MDRRFESCLRDKKDQQGSHPTGLLIELVPLNKIGLMLPQVCGDFKVKAQKEKKMQLAVNLIVVPDDKENRAYSSNEIIQSVEKIGILEPIIVYKEADNCYVLVAGHRRLMSAKHFGLKRVPATVIEKELAVEARAFENIDRAGLSPLDESREIQALANKGYQYREIGAIMGIPVSRVMRRAKLCRLTDSAKDLLVNGKMNLESAEELALVPASVQSQILESLPYGINAISIRSKRWELEGIDLSGTDDEMRSLVGPGGVDCSCCENNPASDEDLFAEYKTLGTCKNIECYCAKLMQYATKKNVQVVSGGFSVVDQFLKDRGVTVLTPGEGDCPRYISPYYTGETKYINTKGQLLKVESAPAPEQKSKEETEEDRIREEYADRYSDVIDCLGPFRKDLCQLVADRIASNLYGGSSLSTSFFASLVYKAGIAHFHNDEELPTKTDQRQNEQVKDKDYRKENNHHDRA